MKISCASSKPTNLSMISYIKPDVFAVGYVAMADSRISVIAGDANGGAHDR